MAVSNRTRTRTPGRAGRPAGNRPGCLIWLIPITLGIVWLLTNKDVRRNLDRFLSGLQQERPVTNGTPRKQPRANGPQTGAREENGSNKPVAATRTEPDNPGLIRDLIRQDQARLADRPAVQDQPSRTDRVPADVHAGKPVRVYFIRYDAGRDVFRLHPAERRLARDDNPARDTLNLLLAGPQDGEKSRGVNTLLPAGTRVRSLRIAAGIVYADFSREFTENLRFGREGLLLQIRQVVETLCQFPAISGVRFLIEGRPAGAVGGDGVSLDGVLRPDNLPPR